MTKSTIKALAFDVFGTVVDYRGTIIREGERLNRAKGLSVDWGQFADAWRARYRPSMDRVMRGELPWTNWMPSTACHCTTCSANSNSMTTSTRTSGSTSTVCGTGSNPGPMLFQGSRTCGNALCWQPSPTGMWPYW